METLRTPLTEMLGIKYPIMLAGMGSVSGHSLVAAVSNAGGIGSLGGATFELEGLRKEIREVKKLLKPGVPFGVDLLIPKVGGGARKTNHDYTHGALPQMADVMIEEGVKLFVCAVGVPPKWLVDKLHAAGIVCMNMVGAPQHVPKRHFKDFSHPWMEGGESSAKAKDFSHPWMEGGESSAKAKDSSNPGLEGAEKASKAKDSSNPGLEWGEKASKAKEQEDTAQVHDLLTLAKAGSWTEVKAVLRRRPELINGRPECRSFGLVHHAAWQIRMDEMEALVLDFGADLGARTKDGKSAEEVLEESVQLGGLSPAESARAAALQKWLRRRSAWRSEASPTSAAPAGSPASGVPAVGPAVAGALAETFAGAAASPASGPREPELKRGGAVLTVCSCLNMKLEGDYVELAKAHNGFPAYWKAAVAGGVLGGAAAHYIYYNFRTSLGWVIDTDLSDSNEPLAYLGASQCGADPSAKAYGEAWKVHCINKIAGGYYSRDSVMRIRRR